nr:retrovirus-related Pol polyprotein from transposon TNT 1-94 [Tanacetum cinerariifolium]
MTKDEAGNKVEVPHVTAQLILARTRERKVKSTLLMAILDEHLARFHGIKDAKTLWAAIKTRSGGNAESKKMQKNVLKQQFKIFSVSNSEGLDKEYDRFQRLLSLLEIHEAGVSTKDANQKFLRSLPSAWSNISLITRNKPGIDNLDTLKVYEADIKGSSGSSSNSHNVTFASAESTSSTNELNAAYSVSIATGHSSQAQGFSSYVDELMFLFFANQSSSLQLDNEDLEKINQDDLEEMDLKWQVAMLSMIVKRFYKKTGRKLEFNGKEPLVLTKPRLSVLAVIEESTLPGIVEQPGIQKIGVEMLGMHGTEEEIMVKGLQERIMKKALVVQDGLGIYDWSYQLEEKATDFTLMAFTLNPLSSSSSNSELDEALREKEYLKAKLEKFETSSKNLTKLLNSQINAKVKTGLGYDSQFNEKEMLDVKEEEVTETVFDNCSSDKDNSLAKDRESRPVWNNVQRINHQNKFAPTAVFTRSGRIPVSSAKPNAATSTSAAKPINTVGPKHSVNFSNSRRNKAYLADYQEINDEGFVAFGSTRGKITSKASIDESNLWHMRLGYVNFKTINKLVKGNLVRGLPSKIFENDHTCVACENEKQHKATCLAGCFSWPLRMKLVRDLDEFCGMKGIKREYTNARTPQQNRVTERKNKTLIKAAKTMLADSLLPITFWAKAVNTACYVLNRPLVTKPHNKTPYELLNGRSPRLDFMRPFGCPVTILYTLDPLGKFKGNQIDKNAGPQDTNSNAGTQDNVDAGKEVFDQHHIDDTGSVVELVNKEDQTYRDELDRLMSQEKEASDAVDSLGKEFEQGCMDQRGASKADSTNSFNTVSTPVNAASTSGTFSAGGPSSPYPDAFIPDDTLLHVDQDDYQIPNLEHTAKLRSTVDLPYEKKAIETKWVYKNKKDERGIVVKNKARLVAQGYRQEEGIDYDEVFASVARIEAIRIFLAFASFIGFIVYQMDVKSAFLYGTIEKKVYVCQPPGFMHLQFPNKNGYRREIIDKTLFIKTNKDDIMLVQVKQSEEGIFISQDKYVAEILKKFNFSYVRTTSTPIETQKPLVKDEEAADVNVYLYRSMIGSLMYLIAFRPDIMFAVCTCSRFHVTPKLSHLHAVKRIFRYLKGQPKLGLWYPRGSPFDLAAYLDSDYAGANLDRESTTGGCQFLGRRLISWQCKKQTIVATSTTEAEDSYEKKLIQVLKIHTEDNAADLLTKAFDVSRDGMMFDLG